MSIYGHDDPRLPLPGLARVSFSPDPRPAHAGEGAGQGAHAGAPVKDANPLDLLTDEALYAACGTRIAFSSRAGGTSEGAFSSLNLSEKVGDAPDRVAANRHRLLAALGAQGLAGRLVVPDQVHGTGLVVVGADVAAAQAQAQAGADAVVCARAQVPVLLCFADCVPVVLVAPGGAFAVAHAGWRGAIGGIAGLSLRRLAKEARCDASECNAYIGPHIGACCYETSEEVLARFTAAFGPACDAGARHLDLSAAVVADLLAAGAAKERIADAGLCTSCNARDYYSYRASGTVTGRHGAYACKEA